MNGLKTTPLHPLFGVEVHDIDLSTVNDMQYAAIREAFETHSLLLFRGQALPDEAHVALARRFGPIEDRYPENRAEGEEFEVPKVSNIREDGTTTSEDDLHTLNLRSNMLWHSDSTFLPRPALTNILIGRVVTETGGETEFASTRAGWAAMPKELKERVRGKGVRHRYSHSRAQVSPELAKLPMFNKWPDQIWHAVWTNPANGAEALYIASHACGIEGMPRSESDILLRELVAFVTQPRFVYSHKWRRGDVLIWDQRAVLHRATPWNYDEPRMLSSICVSVTAADGWEDMKFSG